MLLDCIASDNKILTYYIRLLLTLLNSSSDYSLIIKMRSALNIIYIILQLLSPGFWFPSLVNTIF